MDGSNKPVRLVRQRSAKPTRKVQAQLISGSAVTLAIFILGRLGVDIPSGVVSAAAVLVVGVVAAYQTKNEAG